MGRSMFRNSSRASRSREVMGIAATDLFSNLFVVATLMMVSGATGLPLTRDRVSTENASPIEITVTAERGVTIDGSDPVTIEDLPNRLRAREGEFSVRVLVEPNVPLEREHAVLRAVMETGATGVTLTLLNGETP